MLYLLLLVPCPCLFTVLPAQLGAVPLMSCDHGHGKESLLPSPSLLWQAGSLVDDISCQKAVAGHRNFCCLLKTQQSMQFTM